MKPPHVRSILVIDDETTIRRAIAVFLSDQGYDVREAPDGRAGLACFRRDNPDVILVDLRMPEIDGLEVLRVVAEESPQTPTIVISGTGVMAHAVEALHRGAWDYVLKPIQDMGVLEHSVVKVIERAELIRENRAHQERLEEQIKQRTAELESANRALTEQIDERMRAEDERRSLEAQLRHAQKMEAVGQLAGGVAHDFNNVLTAILGNAELAERSIESFVPPDSRATEALKQIEQSALRAAGLTRQLLAFSRRQVSQPRVIDLNRTLIDMDGMLRRLLTENIHLTMHNPPAVGNIRIDPGQMEQVIMNLVVNARDAMPNGGKLIIETADANLDDAYGALHAEAKPGPHVMLSVSDTGVGMTGETQERVFEPFFTTKVFGRGTGLGLAMVYGIVQQVGGHITVYSEPGRGTTFKVFVPMVELAAEPAEVRGDDIAAPHGTETLAVCEDDPLVRNLMIQILEGAGYGVMGAEDGEQTLNRVRECDGKVSLLITDVIIPDMNGQELSETVRSIVPGIKTLFVSGYTANVIAHHGVLDEGVEFLEKPFNRQSLLRRVRELLDRQLAPTI